MKRLGLLIYAWGSAFLFALVIYWLATLPNFQAGTQVNDEVIKVVFKMIMYAILFILIYRAVILTLKSTVDRLSGFRSKGEAIEDSEFVLIIETLVIVMVASICMLFAFFEEHVQYYVAGRNGGETYLVAKKDGTYTKSEAASDISGNTYINLKAVTESSKDILVSTMAILLTAIVSYSTPVIGELEVALKHKFDREVKALKGKNKWFSL